MKNRAVISALFLSIVFFTSLSFAEVEPPTPLTVNESFDSDLLTGTFTTRIPIKVAPGINGMQPDIALAYNSRSGNGWVGVGWDLSGLGYIELDPNARFKSYYERSLLDCENHPKVLNMNGAHKLVSGGDENYHTNPETFLRIEKVSDSWVVTGKDGTRYEFGTDAGSIVAGKCGDGTDGTRRWLLNRVTDTNGNSMNISYVQYQVVPANYPSAYLSKITYDNREVEFLLEDRNEDRNNTDTIFDHELFGTIITITKKLSAIRITMGGNIVRSYRLSYITSDKTDRLLLESVREVGPDEIEFLPEIKFDYKAPSGNVIWDSASEEASSLTLPDAPGNGRFVDIDGDGRDDFAVIGDVVSLLT